MWTANMSGREIAGWGDTLLYAYSDGDVWSVPTDVLAVQAGETAESPDLMVGTDGNLHVIWRHDTELLHSWAPLSEARRPQSWHTSYAIASVPPGSRPCHATTDDQGAFHVVCARQTEEGWGLIYLRSDVGGLTWHGPLAVREADREHGVDLPRLAIDADGGIHVTWTESRLPDGWPLLGVFYSRSVDGGQTWSASTQLATDQQGYSTIATTQTGHIHVVWNSSAFGRHHRWSEDGGRTWSDDILVSAAAGTTQGAPAIAIDSASAVHVIMFDSPAGLDRADDIRYSSWDGATWTPLRLLSEGETGVYVAFPAAVISEGNRLHGVWCNLATSEHPTPNLEQNSPGIWYVKLETAAPRMSPTINEVLKPTPVEPMDALVSGPETPTVQAALPQSTALPVTSVTQSATASDSSLVTLAGPLTAAVVVLTVVAAQLNRKKGR